MRLAHVYETLSRIYEQASDRICFITGSTAGIVIQAAPKEETNWPEFLVKTIIAGLAPLLLKKAFDAIGNYISTKKSQ